MRNTFTHALKTVRTHKKRLRIILAAEVTAGVIMIACAARNIETDQPWWLLTVSFLFVAWWARMASRTADNIAAAKEDEDKLQTMSDAWEKGVTDLRNLGMPEELLDVLNGCTPPTDEPEPAPAGEPVDDTAGPTPTSDDTTPTKP